MKDYINLLNGISYEDWIKLKNGIDKKFEQQEDELKKTLKLADPDKVLKLIQSQFGQTWD